MGLPNVGYRTSLLLWVFSLLLIVGHCAEGGVYDEIVSEVSSRICSVDV